MPVYPGDPAPDLHQIAEIDKDGFVDHQIITAMHAGTHMDAPAHMLNGGKMLSDYSAEKFFGRGHLLDARSRSVIDEDLLVDSDIQAEDIVLVMTGFYEKFGQPEYFEKYVEFTESFAKRLLDFGVSAIGMDTPSPDRPPFAVHKLLLAHDILIIENLTNLDQLLNHSSFEVVALPAKFQTNAAPCRVVAKIL
ncbi:MAG: cyclase family protein [Candidatus Doudnabacteria bacterium]|nr:cyclase family protein [Candidatus Doudnabacteria bacterium]